MRILGRILSIPVALMFGLFILMLDGALWWMDVMDSIRNRISYK